MILKVLFIRIKENVMNFNLQQLIMVFDLMYSLRLKTTCKICYREKINWSYLNKKNFCKWDKIIDKINKKIQYIIINEKLYAQQSFFSVIISIKSMSITSFGFFTSIEVRCSRMVF